MIEKPKRPENYWIKERNIRRYYLKQDCDEQNDNWEKPRKPPKVKQQ